MCLTKTPAEKTCNKCGATYYAQKNTLCPDCDGIMCSVITPVPGKRVSGVLCRDRNNEDANDEICFLPNMDAKLTDYDGKWTWADGNSFRYWSKERWKEQYGKLPRKGSKQVVILELISGQ